MLFNSVDFVLFFTLIFIIYWFVLGKRMRLQNFMLVAASYFFYCCWDWRFGFLLAFSTLLDFYSGLAIFRSTSKKLKKIWLVISVGINLGFLCFFKYYNFFIESFAELLENFGVQANYSTLNIILPVGISFYTFHGLSYVFDIYNEKIKPTTNLVNYTLFVSFFPLLVAGPIERATHLLPQIEKPRKFKYSKSVDGLKQILWGFFKKVVIADNCAQFANVIFDNYEDQSGSTLILGALFFTFQIYGDFSGYTDIALGTARLMGFELLKNFNFPYFSRDIAEFWRRWHISLSTWFKDYLYIPLGGSRGGLWMKIRNTFIIFIVSGFWHGSNWTFIIWGALNAIYFLPLLLTNNNRNNLEIVAFDRALPTFKDSIRILSTFSLTVLAWIFFRSESVDDALNYIYRIFSYSTLTYPEILSDAKYILMLVCTFLIIEWIGRRGNYGLQLVFKSNRFIRWSLYSVIVLFIIFYSGDQQEFIYFQF